MQEGRRLLEAPGGGLGADCPLQATRVLGPALRSCTCWAESHGLQVQIPFCWAGACSLRYVPACDWACILPAVSDDLFCHLHFSLYLPLEGSVLLPGGVFLMTLLEAFLLGSCLPGR